MPTKRKTVRLSLDLTIVRDELPTEFRIFTADEVVTTKGTFVFDAKAAAAVMAKYEAHGIDLMIDYDHASLAALTIDPAQAGKAAGWFNLAVRNGELWAVNVRWTPPAAEALRNKEWRFMSPAFETVDDRIVSVMNVAITNLPATRNLEPLMAANAKGDSMSIEEFLKVCKALGLDMTMSLDDAMSKIKGGDADAATEDAPPPKGDGGADEATEPVAAAAPAAPPADEKKDAPAAVAASLSRFMRLSGKVSIVAALAEAEIWRASHLKLETETQKLAAERAILESVERHSLCAKLVTDAGKAPAAVWADDKAVEPKPYLAKMSIEDLRAMVADEIKACGGKPKSKAPPKGPASVTLGSKTFETSQGAVTLSAGELDACERAGAKPEHYALNKAIRDAQRSRGKKE